MSNRAVAAAPPPSAGHRPAPASTTGHRMAVAPTPGAPTATTRHRTRSTPQRLRLWTLASVAACALLALASVLVLLNGALAMRNASADTQQQIRMQSIRANLLRADALATNAFLVGGLEPAEQRAEYDRALRETTELITAAAASQPADQEALTVLSQAVIRYAGDMEQARANNRQGFPVGAAYLASASSQLRGTAIPILDNLVEENQNRASRQMSVLDNGFVEVAGVVCLVVLIMTMVWTARRFKRAVNPGLAVATVLVLATWVIGVASLSTARSSVDEVSGDAMARISAAGVARSAASEAKVQESLRLIARGSGAAAEQEWQTQAGFVDQILDGPLDDQRDLRRSWQAYVDQHDAIVKLDDAGRYADAVEQATADGDDSANARFAGFDAQAAALAADASDDAVGRLGGVATNLWILLALMSAASIAAAVSATIGLRARLREYL